MPDPDSLPAVPPPDKPASVFARLGAVGPLAIIAGTFPGLAGILLLWKISTISEWLKSHADYGLYIYIVAFAILAGLALLPTVSQAILGGYAFGITIGIPAALVGFLGGGIIGYEIARRLSKDRVQQLIDEKPKWRAVRNALLGRGEKRDFFKTTGMVILLRLPPNSPFALMNLLLAAVKVPRGPYLIGTMIGMTPRTALAVIVGAGIKEALTKEAIDQATPRWVWITGIAVTVIIVLIIGSMANRAIERIGKQEAAGPGV